MQVGKLLVQVRITVFFDQEGFLAATGDKVVDKIHGDSPVNVRTARIFAYGNILAINKIIMTPLIH